ncbi:hypothetical protein OV079_28810 [Nannocystis pusilla]|uniref:Uncharacterized protein n=1 Tax=Nannocystis pusilla TaxID=889268 RepID=A0A9X3ET50_9BACT|nr:hypothetical protein [Nannocystis pusilla]MCY1009496.1 hypothetical protein [Nannocystis pusilla]
MLEVEIDVEVVEPPPTGAPLDFRERLVLALKTTDASVLAAAERAFRGVWPSIHDYIVERLAADLPPGLGWVLRCCDPAGLRRGYEAGEREVWAIPLGHGQAMVFESDQTLVGAPTS